MPDHPDLNLSADEKQLFGRVFSAADTDNLGVVTGEAALKFFPQRTKLPPEVLGEVSC
jgi:epidermal growth factor receptor substrate 15